MTEQGKPMSESFGQVEALLFISSGLISIGQIAKALEISESEVRRSCKPLTHIIKSTVMAFV